MAELNKADTSAGPGNILALMKIAYWVALFTITILIGVSYSKFNAMMGDYERDRILLETGSNQLIVAQRIVSLAEQLGFAASEEAKLKIVRDLSLADREFKNKQAVISAWLAPSGENVSKTGALLDWGPGKSLSHALDAEAKRLSEATGKIIAIAGAGKESSGSGYAAALADNRHAFENYRHLNGRLRRFMWERIQAAQDAQRELFLGTLILMAFFALLIFGPVASLLARKTKELIAVNNELAFTAAHDELTGLHNRAFLADHFETVISGARRRNERVAIMQIDLDLFKEVNDTLGHAAGDYVLVKTAERLRDTCRASDLCVRMGGDEFLVVLNGIGETNDINRVAKRIIEHINQPINYEGVTVAVGASAGIAVYPVDGDRTEDLLVQADLALYKAKDRGGGSYQFFSAELRRELEHRRQLETDLQAAIKEKAFVPFFQPQISLPDRKVTAMEALVRWQHPERGLVAPGEFMKIAQQTGLIVDIGRINMDRAIERAGTWHRAGIAFGRLSLNVSDAELREPDFADFIFSMLKKYRLPARKLSLEIIETVILDNDQAGIGRTLSEIRRKGVQIELDDFGTGYASLSHVNSQQVDRLKIDRRFVTNIDRDGNNSKIVRAIAELARGLGLSVVAEGAETESEVAFLTTLGCDQVQGYSIACPMPENEATQWLNEQAEGKRIVPLSRVAAG